MTNDQRITSLVAGALLLEHVANSIGAAALAYRHKNSLNEERSLSRMARSHRIRALLAYGRAAALCGCVIDVSDLKRWGGLVASATSVAVPTKDATHGNVR